MERGPSPEFIKLATTAVSGSFDVMIVYQEDLLPLSIRLGGHNGPQMFLWGVHGGERVWALETN